MKNWNFINAKIKQNKLYWFTDNRGVMIKGYIQRNDFNYIMSPFEDYNCYEINGYAHDNFIYGKWLYKPINFFEKKPKYPKFINCMKNVNYFYGILKEFIKEDDFKFYSENKSLISASINSFNRIELYDDIVKNDICYFTIKDFTINSNFIAWNGGAINNYGNCVYFDDIKDVCSSGDSFTHKLAIELKDGIVLKFTNK